MEPETEAPQSVTVETRLNESVIVEPGLNEADPERQERRTLRHRRPASSTVTDPTVAPPASWSTGSTGLTEVPESAPPRMGRTPEEFWKSIAIPSIWALLIAVVAAGITGFIGANYERTRPPVYSSEAVMLFDNASTIAVDPGAVISISQERGKYAGLVGTDLISVPAAAIANVSVGAIEGSVHAIATPTTLNIFIVSVAPSARLAQTLALAVAQAMVTYVTNEQAAFAPSLRLTATITTNPRLGGRISPTHKKEITTGAAVAIGTFLVVYIAGQILADQQRVRRRRVASV
jgi:hypothetical protein